MVRFSALFAACALAAFVWFAPGASSAAPLNAADRALVTRAETALNAIRSIDSRFFQASSNGGYARGRLYVDRPGNLRIDYAPPTPLQIYADGFWLIYLDSELKEASYVPVDRTPAAFLVRDKLRLSGDLTVRAVRRTPDRVWIELFRTDSPDAGGLRLGLEPAALALREWVVTDAQGVETRVALVDPQINKPIDKRIFVYTPPAWANDPPEMP